MKFFNLVLVSTSLCLAMTFAGTKLFAAGGKCGASTPDSIKKGEGAYKTNNCNLCHGDKGDGKGPAAATLNPKARDFITEKYKLGDTPEKVFKTITDGSPGTSMTGYASLPEDVRCGLAHYVLSLKKK